MFRIGDTVLCIHSVGYKITEGNLYKILDYGTWHENSMCSVSDDYGRIVSMCSDRVVSANPLTLKGRVISLTTKCVKIDGKICKLTNCITVLQNEYVELKGYMKGKIFVVCKKEN